eukprot:TRINITY_DN10241_c0_g1_i2.p1 TRINITY_DN10241_c0_g1~~TRINITY_DN10241_c0_g1_i2.p1  ORF type:complete len:591 (-),score=95.04 TRINITY_DN10241_c0_g1_i2:29-1750(-)
MPSTGCCRCVSCVSPGFWRQTKRFPAEDSDDELALDLQVLEALARSVKVGFWLPRGGKRPAELLRFVVSAFSSSAGQDTPGVQCGPSEELADGAFREESVSLVAGNLSGPGPIVHEVRGLKPASSYTIKVDSVCSLGRRGQLTASVEVQTVEAPVTAAAEKGGHADEVSTVVPSDLCHTEDLEWRSDPGDFNNTVFDFRGALQASNDLSALREASSDFRTMPVTPTSGRATQCIDASARCSFGTPTSTAATPVRGSCLAATQQAPPVPGFFFPKRESTSSTLATTQESTPLPSLCLPQRESTSSTLTTIQTPTLPPASSDSGWSGFANEQTPTAAPASSDSGLSLFVNAQVTTPRPSPVQRGSSNVSSVLNVEVDDNTYEITCDAEEPHELLEELDGVDRLEPALLRQPFRCRDVCFPWFSCLQEPPPLDQSLHKAMGPRAVTAIDATTKVQESAKSTSAMRRSDPVSSSLPRRGASPQPLAKCSSRKTDFRPRRDPFPGTPVDPASVGLAHLASPPPAHNPPTAAEVAARAAAAAASARAAGDEAVQQGHRSGPDMSFSRWVMRRPRASVPW